MNQGNDHAVPAGTRVGLHVGQLLQRIPGGIGRYVGILHDGLRRRGVDVISFAAGAAPAGLGAVGPSASSPSAPDTEGYVDLGWPRGGLRYELWHRLRRPALPIEVDLVHAPSLAVPPPGGAPLVVTVHDLAFLRLPQYFTIRGLRFHERGLELARSEAAVVVAPSEFVAGELVAEGFEAARVHVAHHGIDDPGKRSATEVDAVLRRLGVERPFMLFVGTLEPRKGLDTLVEGHRILHRARHEVSLALVGARGWGRLPRLDRPGVVQLGNVPDDDLDALYRAATALAYPSEYEGFGLPALEAMVRGCPVVTSSATSLPEVVGSAGRLVDPSDPEQLATVLTEILDDADLRAILAKAGRARARNFTWDASVNAHLAAYAAAVARVS
ncbi:MAG: glycosyltransferase family 4 protein [Actinobacteria bacterium]|nr:glycosyltransferase family 4 protein [Actinomycetota bacterium]